VQQIQRDLGVSEAKAWALMRGAGAHVEFPHYTRLFVRGDHLQGLNADRDGLTVPEMGWQPRLHAYLNAQSRRVHLVLEKRAGFPNEEYPETFSLCGKVVATLGAVTEDPQAARRLDELHTAFTESGLAAALREIYPDTEAAGIEDVLLRVETLIDAALATPELRSWGMLDLGPATPQTVPTLAGSKICGMCLRSPFAKALK
jgi:hypothetical protein